MVAAMDAYQGARIRRAEFDFSSGKETNGTIPNQ
jgi:hypothetical protein